MNEENGNNIWLLFGILLRWSVSLWPYSGAGKPPMFGDYEAQRHWQEITSNLPMKEWYTNSSQNDLLYWGLDYPPLTAYHSYLCGQVAKLINPDFVALENSRGYESDEHKLFMRYSVFFADLLVYIPAVLLFISACGSSNGRLVHKESYMKALMIYPGVILIDYGHFQYNNVSLGFFIGAVGAILKNWDCSGAFLFVLALNYKQMELYHALPFFCYLLGKCFQTGSIRGFAWKLTKIGITVVVTFFVIWLPFLESWESAFQVLIRLFPVARGVFEDKVANVWCSLNVIVKFKQIISNSGMALLCFVFTLAGVLPSSINLLLNPSHLRFQYALVNCSLSFFLLSFQVHEKSFLLVMIAALLLVAEERQAVAWLGGLSIGSMLPLLDKDGLSIPSLAISFIYLLSFDLSPPTGALANKKNKTISFCMWLSIFGLLLLSAAHVFITPPANLPDIFPLLISMYSCANFSGFLVYFHYRQFNIGNKKYIQGRGYKIKEN